MLRVALWQMRSGGSMARCRESVLQGIARAAGQGAHVVSFPENSLALGCDDARPLGLHELEWVAEAARQYAIDVCLGVIERPEDDEKLEDAGAKKAFNSLVWYSSDGQRTVYRKRHLFDHAPSNLRESSSIEAGSELVTVKCRGVTCGLAICYDLRFPNMFLRYAGSGCKVIFAPSAFTVPTGQAHFRSLVAARALDSQCFVAAAAQWGQHSVKRASWGESCIADPWGKVLVAAEPTEDLLLVQDCDTGYVDEVRARMPLQQHALNGLDF
jgi:predicted amidohydrolase